ncbi:unnamed protein product, partial [Tilletia controversa]
MSVGAGTAGSGAVSTLLKAIVELDRVVGEVLDVFNRLLRVGQGVFDVFGQAFIEASVKGLVVPLKLSGKLEE